MANSHSEFAVGRYDDGLHAGTLNDIQVGKYGYKYRMLEGVVMPPYITPEKYDLSRTLDMRPEDICLTGYPKSGTNWISYILLMIIQKGEVPTDKTLHDSVHWVANSFIYPRTRAYLDTLPNPRLFSSHMPYHMAVGGNPSEGPCKHVYIARNPKDVVVSYYYFEKSKSWAGEYEGQWEHWFEMFLAGEVQRGDWFDHVLSWWKHRDSDYILFVTYEDLKAHFDDVVRRVAAFLDYPMPPELLHRIKEKTSFQNMKEDQFSDMHDIEELGGFFRKGQVGSWKDQFTPTQRKRFDRIYADRMKGSGLEFA